MPWCEHCDRYLTPSTVRPDFSCPWCGRFVDPGRLATVEATMEDTVGDGVRRPEDEGLPPLPWHFKFLVVALVLYLGVRAWQGVEWVMQRM